MKTIILTIAFMLASFMQVASQAKSKEAYSITARVQYVVNGEVKITTGEKRYWIKDPAPCYNIVFMEDVEYSIDILLTEVVNGRQYVKAIFYTYSDQQETQFRNKNIDAEQRKDDFKLIIMN